MSDIAKWILLGVGFIAIIGMILALPITQSLGDGSSAFSSSIVGLVTLAGNILTTFRKFINNFFTSAGRQLLSVALIWILTKKFLTFVIKLTVGVYRAIFK